MAFLLPAKRKKEDYASVDFETRAAFVNLKQVGAYRYVEDPYFDVNCLGWAINNEPVQVWRRGQKPPRDLVRHIERGGMLHAWHALFERVVWRSAPSMKDFPTPDRKQYRCTMVRALSCGLPGKLEFCAPALGIKERKDTEGAKAMRKLAKPRKITEDMEVIWWDGEDLWETMMKYCGQDVVTERAIGHRLPYLQQGEEKQYWYDQLVADRGVPLDKDLCHKAIWVAQDAQEELKKKCVEISGISPTQVQALRIWINGQNVIDLPNLQKDTIEKALRSKELPKDSPIRTVLQARQEAGRSSTSKFDAALDCVCKDGTLKGMRQFYGAHTGRWAGRNVQMDNMFRTTMKDIDEIIAAVKTGDANIVASCYNGKVMEPVANTIRSMIVAKPDHTLYVGDYKSIESRLLAETSGQTSVLKQWALSDMGLGPDVYVVNAAQMFNCTMERASKKDYRFWGKTAELSLGYEAGQNSLLKKGEETGADYEEIFDIMHGNASPHTREKVVWLYGKMGENSGFSKKAWMAARYVVENWRARNPMSVKLWKGLHAAALRAMENPNTFQRYRDISYYFDKELQILFCDTNSGGEPLKYPFAHTVAVGMNRDGTVRKELRAKYYDVKRGFVTYALYGGLETENVVQNRARNTMAGNFGAVEKKGFKLLHTVHDELITMAPIALGLTVAEFREAACTHPVWASKAFPLAMDAWSGPFYKKED